MKTIRKFSPLEIDVLSNALHLQECKIMSIVPIDRRRLRVIRALKRELGKAYLIEKAARISVQYA